MSAASSVTFNTDSKQPTHVPVTFLSVSGDNTIKIWTEQILDANDNTIATSTSTFTSSTFTSAPHSNASVSTRSITSSTPTTPPTPLTSSASTSTPSSTSTTPQQSPRNHTVKTRWRLLKTYEGDTAEIRHMRQLPDGRFVIQVFGPQLTIIGIDAGPTIAESSVDSPIGTGASAFTHVSELKGHSQYVMGLRVHTSGKLMSASIDGYIKLWNTDTNEADISFAHGHTGLLTGAAVLCDGRVATTSYDKTIRIFDPMQKKHLFTLEGHGDAVVSSIALSDNRLLSWTQAEMKLWDTDSYECVNTINEGMVLNAIGLPDGRAAVSSWDKTIKIYAWDLSSVQIVLRGHTGSVMSTAYIPHQRLCSGAYDQTIRVWDLVTGRCLHVLNAHTSFVKCINHIQYPVDGWILRARARQAAAAAASNVTATATSTTVPSVVLPPLLPLNVMT